MKRVLVTGASGFLGRQCIPALFERGYQVHATTRHSMDGPKGIVWHRVDLHDSSHVASMIAEVRPTHLLHCAWYAEPGAYITSPENLRWVSSSLTLVKKFAEEGGQRAVGVGSGFEYDMRYGYCSETLTPLVPSTLYGSAKLALGRLLEAYASEVDLSHAWGRIFFLYGPHEHPNRLVSSIVRKLLLGEHAETSHGRQVRDYLHIADAGEALAELLDGTAIGPVNIASGKPVAVRDIVQEIARRLGREDLLSTGALQTRSDEVPFVVADVTRLSEEIGWSPRFDLSEGLVDTIAWWSEDLQGRGELDGEGAPSPSPKVEMPR